mmetsp:Transcript_19501/g.53419  ORF Transcript_19501/g.53419 Transcript_19501/m.53419 type:complete len:187 (+) Transcript_19501:47-607(+)
MAWTGEPMELWGGAVLCELPASFHDASKLREVPDHQEVWVDEASDRSVIFEILERKEDVSDQDAVDFFVTDLATANDARDCVIQSSRRVVMDEEMPHLPVSVACLRGVCEQTVAKFNEGSANRIQVHICVVRLLEQATDLLITFNNPVSIDAQSSSAGAEVLQGGDEFFARVLRSFEIRDWELFSA